MEQGCKRVVLLQETSVGGNAKDIDRAALVEAVVEGVVRAGGCTPQDGA